MTEEKELQPVDIECGKLKRSAAGEQPVPV